MVHCRDDGLGWVFTMPPGCGGFFLYVFINSFVYLYQAVNLAIYPSMLMVKRWREIDILKKKIDLAVFTGELQFIPHYAD